jgi:nitrite reductase/ring-hydroxylating ferredoxin subunit
VTTFGQSSARLVAVDDLGASQVVVVETTAHGALAVGVSAGKPFAVSNRCHHLFASLGKGHVTDDGCLQCPWHAALYDVGSGAMVRGPQHHVGQGGGGSDPATTRESIRDLTMSSRLYGHARSLDSRALTTKHGLAVANPRIRV